MLSLNKDLQRASTSFTALLQSKFSFTQTTKKLQNWHKLAFGEFLKELEKARKKETKATTSDFSPIPLAEQAEWMQYFNEQKQKVQALKIEINQTDKEIDQLVYELYNLTEEEINSVEEAST